MQFFVDTAVIADIRELNDYGLLDGVTTNPSLIAKSGRDFKDVIAEICALVEGPVSAEVAALDAGAAADNCLHPDALRRLDRELLRDALRVVKAFQQQLRIAFHLGD